jgi:RNA polymerase sigma-70 factor (ECF subfamily)
MITKSGEIPFSTRSNQDWLAALQEPASPEALTELREILLRGLRAGLSSRIDGDLDALTEDFAQDAILKVLASLDTFRGESRFITWAQKIAIHVAFSELRRRRWKDVPLQTLIETAEGEEYTPALLTDPVAGPERQATRMDVMNIVEDLVQEELTERQREALLAILQANVPLGEVARQLNTNPNALYKLLHDARKRLQQRLEEKSGLKTQEVFALFEND